MRLINFRMFQSLGLDSGFPYNGNQKRLHYSEDRMLKDIKWKVKKHGKSKVEKREIYKRELLRLEEIKNQNPHPAKVFAPFPCCFWDTDVYWLHWEFNKSLIIPRMTMAYSISIDEDCLDEKVQRKYAQKNADFIEMYYSIKDIESTLRKTREVTDPLVYQLFAKKYNLKNFESYHWWES